MRSRYGINTRNIGCKYEKAAVDFLEKNGYIILDKNYRCKFGEVDIIACEKKGNDIYLIFTEVKYRSSDRYGTPFEAVDLRKQHKIIQTAKYYIKDKDMSIYSGIRFDVVGILGNEVSIIKNAFGGY